MFHHSQQLVILLALTLINFMLAGVFAERAVEAENQSLSDSILTASMDDINDDEVFRQYSTKPYFYPYLQQKQQQSVHPPTQLSTVADDNLNTYQQPASASLYNMFGEPKYYLSTDNDNRATVEVVESSMLPDQKFDNIVEYLLQKLEREDQQMIDSIYDFIFDSDHKPRPLEDNTTVEPPKQTQHRKCFVCKKDFKQQSEPKN